MFINTKFYICKLGRVEKILSENYRENLMKIRGFLNQMVYYSYKQDRANYTIRCMKPEECDLECQDGCVEIAGNLVTDALASRFEWRHPKNNQRYSIPYTHIREVVNQKTGRHIPILLEEEQKRVSFSQPMSSMSTVAQKY